MLLKREQEVPTRLVNVYFNLFEQLLAADTVSIKKKSKTSKKMKRKGKTNAMLVQEVRSLNDSMLGAILTGACRCSRCLLSAISFAI